MDEILKFRQTTPGSTEILNLRKTLTLSLFLYCCEILPNLERSKISRCKEENGKNKSFSFCTRDFRPTSVREYGKRKQNHSFLSHSTCLFRIIKTFLLSFLLALIFIDSVCMLFLFVSGDLNMRGRDVTEERGKDKYE